MKSVFPILSMVFSFSIFAKPEFIEIKSLPLEDYVVTHQAHTVERKIFPFSYSCLFLKEKCEGKEMIDLPEIFVARVNDTKIFSRGRYILYKDKAFIRDVIQPWDENTDILFQPDVILPETEYCDGTLAVLSQSAQVNYYHWLMEVLPRFKILQDSGLKYDRIYAPYYQQPFQEDSWKHLGVSEENIVHVKDGHNLAPNAVVFPSFPGVYSVSPDWVIPFLRKTFLLSEPMERKRRIFLSRKNAQGRGVTNEEALSKKLMSRFGIETVVLDDLSISEQAMLFSEANLIVAPHGAALANLVFTNPNTKVLELFAYRLDPTFFRLSEQLQLDYHALLALEDKTHKDLLIKDPIFYKEMQLPNGPSADFDIDLILNTISQLGLAEQID